MTTWHKDVAPIIERKCATCHEPDGVVGPITWLNIDEADGSEPLLRNGSKGLPAEAPFDVIVLSGSVAEVPQALLSQLKVGGRLAAIVGFEPVMRTTIVTRTGDASFDTAQPWDTVAPRLAHFPEPSRFHF